MKKRNQQIFGASQRVILIALCLLSFTRQSSAFDGKSGTFFIENKGQLSQVDGTSADYVSFYYQRNNANIYLLREGGIAYQFQRTHYPDEYEALLKQGIKYGDGFFEARERIRVETFRMDMILLGSNPNARIESEGESPDFINYFNEEQIKAYHFQRVRYKDVYPNIDWEIYIQENGDIKYDFIVHPGGNPNQIQLSFSNHDSLYLDNHGNLVHTNRLGYFIEDAPISFQGSDLITTMFVLENDILSFKVEEYDSSKKLVIDPQRIWGTYYGGVEEEIAYSTSVDSENNVYLAGWTRSSSMISSMGFQNNIGGNADAFLVKFDSTGSRLWATYYGGNESDYGHYCTVDKNDNVYLVGETGSSSGISFNGHQNSIGGSVDAFLVKFDKNGNRIWATYYGGSFSDIGWSAAVDNNNNVYMVGTTNSINNISFNGFQSSHSGPVSLIGPDPLPGSVYQDAFIVKFDSNGVRLWASYYGGGETDIGYTCATDNIGNVFLGGYTTSVNNISFLGFQNNNQGGVEGYLVKFDSLGIRQWATYFGGSHSDVVYSCITDNQNNIIIVGSTLSQTNIAFNALHQNTFGSSGGVGGDGFIAKFDNNGTGLWATYFGGFQDDAINSCAVDLDNNLYVAGNTSSSNDIAFDGFQMSLGGGIDGFLGKFDANGNRIWATYYGGILLDIATTVSADNSNRVYVGGYTESSWPTSSIASSGFQNNLSGNRDGFLAKFDCSVYSSVNFSTCDFFESPSGKYIWTSSGVYFDTIVNSRGCDSIIEITLIVHNSSQTYLNVSSCNSYFWNLNNQIYNSSGLYNDTLTNIYGCDSIIYLNLTIFSSDTINQNVQACDSFFWSQNSTTYSQSGIYSVSFQNENGCDSLIILNLTILESTYSNQTVVSCDSYVWGVNNQVYSTSGIFTHTLTNAIGCDSILTLYLTINTSSTSSTSDSACFIYEWDLNGRQFFQSGIYTDTLINVLGCDSILFLDLIIDTVDTRVLDSAASLVAQAANATFQWLNCDNSFVPVRGATANVFSPSDNSLYAVEIRQNGCVDTSECYSILDIGVVEFEKSDIRLYPNPNSGEFSIDLGREFKECTIIIHDVNGRQVARFREYDSRFVTKSINVASGVYVVQIFTEYGFKNVLMTVL